MPNLVVPARFNGPPRSGNGGWVAGALAAHLPSTGEHGTRVTLRRPPPLDTALEVRLEGQLARLEDDGRLVAEAGPAPAGLTPVAPVGPDEARAASTRFGGHHRHPFPGCFVCGTDRAEGDGLRLFAGPLDDGERRTATTWTPAPDVADTAGTWAALDCPGGWTTDIEGRPSVLGRIDAVVHRLPRAGVVHVVVAQARGEEGRKSFTAASLYDVAGEPELIATAEHVWIAIDPKEFS